MNLTTVKIRIQAGSQMKAGSPIQAGELGRFESLVLIEAGSQIQAGSRLGATW